VFSERGDALLKKRGPKQGEVIEKEKETIWGRGTFTGAGKRGRSTSVQIPELVGTLRDSKGKVGEGQSNDMGGGETI